MYIDIIVLTKIQRDDNTLADSLALLRTRIGQEIVASKHKVRVLTELSIVATGDIM